jgi:hypothetical protein
LQNYVGSSISLGINEVISQESIVVYPNPFIQGQKLKIEVLEANFTFTLFDANGKIILKKLVLQNEIDLNGSFLNGIYFYRIETSNKIFNGKLKIE